jgi:hypothetical protein
MEFPSVLDGLSADHHIETNRKCSDELLIAMVRSGDSTAFDALMERHGAKLFARILRITKHIEDAEDSLQDTFLAAYLTQHSIWYAVNLLGGAGVAQWRNPTTADIAAFHWNGLIIATIIHASVCTLIGLLYGAMLPMWPKRPILLGGLIAPLLWTGLLHSILGFVNPAFNSRIAWGWFALSEILFGIVAGVVVTRTGKIRTHQALPFVLRMGIEAKEFNPKKEDQP